MKERQLYIGKQYRHFKKGNFYRVIEVYDSNNLDIDDSITKLTEEEIKDKEYVVLYCIATNATNSEEEKDIRVYCKDKDVTQLLITKKDGTLIRGKYVLYYGLYNSEFYIRQYDEFMSPVEDERKDKYNQKWKFQYCDVQPTMRLI